jgi:hypothetical protein
LPVGPFDVVFTLPAEIADIAYQNGPIGIGRKLFAMAVAHQPPPLGVVFGNIGTSPHYALKEASLLFGKGSPR